MDSDLGWSLSRNCDSCTGRPGALPGGAQAAWSLCQSRWGSESARLSAAVIMIIVAPGLSTKFAAAAAAAAAGWSQAVYVGFPRPGIVMQPGLPVGKRVPIKVH